MKNKVIFKIGGVIVLMAVLLGGTGCHSINNRNKANSNRKVKQSPVVKRNTTPIVVHNTSNTDYSNDDIKLPQYVVSHDRKYSVWFTNGNYNIDMLEEACDYTNAYTKTFANQLAARHEGSFSFEQVCEIYSYCYNKWRYVNDPKDQEYVARASESIAALLTGDCDDYAILMAASILAIGGNASIITASNYSSGHAYAELEITSMNQSHIIDVVKHMFPKYSGGDLHIRTDAIGRIWLNLDWTAAYPGGKHYDHVDIDVYTRANGKWNWNYN